MPFDLSLATPFKDKLKSAAIRVIPVEIIRLWKSARNVRSGMEDKPGEGHPCPEQAC